MKRGETRRNEREPRLLVGGSLNELLLDAFEPI